MKKGNTIYRRVEKLCALDLFPRCAQCRVVDLQKKKIDERPTSNVSKLCTNLGSEPQGAK